MVLLRLLYHQNLQLSSEKQIVYNLYYNCIKLVKILDKSLEKCYNFKVMNEKKKD